MFELTILDEVYEFNFGIGFVRDIDKLVTTPIQGMNGTTDNVGLAYYTGKLYEGDVVALVDVLDVANKNKKPRITQAKLCEYIEDESTDIEKLFEDVLGFLKTSNATKTKVLKIARAMGDLDENQGNE